MSCTRSFRRAADTRVHPGRSILSPPAAHLRAARSPALRCAAWVALAIVTGGPSAAAVPARPCAGVRFLVDEALVPGTSLPSDAVAIDAAGYVTIAGGCPATRAAIGRRGGRASLHVRWAACGAARNVRLNAIVDDPACTTLVGTVRARGTGRHEFTGRASACGDGRLDPSAGEECETAADCPSGEPCTGCTCAAAMTRRKKTTTTTTATTTTSTTRQTVSTTTSSTSTSKPTTTSTTQPASTTTTVTTTLTATTVTTTVTTTTGTTTTTTVPGGLFEAANPWNADISTLPKSATSDTIIQALAGAGGWGTGTLRIDFSIQVLRADATTPFLTFTPTADFYTPDCDHVPFPVPPGGALEGETGYQCVSDGDCHLIVVHQPTKTLYEMWRANIVGTTFTGGCAAVWDLTRSYPTTLRGDQCTSADAGGFPIAAMLFSADEVAAGAINHAIRFILPNSRMRSGVYVRPATHAGAPSGGASLPPYGVLFRLRPDFPLASLPTEGARVVARAMQRYGMILADGGNIALTAQNDRFTTHKWSEVGVDTYALQAIHVTDMEVVGMGTPVTLTYDCVRNP
jgi:hypothetical protein